MAEPVPQIQLTGPIFVGTILNWCLLGSLVIQVYIYSQNSDRDRWGIRFLVYSLLVLDLIQTGVTTDHAWKTLVQFWGDPKILSTPASSSVSVTIMAGIISAVVQLFFAWRIWFLNTSKIGRMLAILIVLVALMQSISVVVASIRFTLVHDLSELPSLTSGFVVWLAGSFTADVLIAGCMLYILKKAQANSFSTRTDTIVSRLITNTIQTGAITAVAAGVELVLFLVVKGNNYHETPAFLLGKLYSNVLLANLNARAQNKRLGIDTQLTSTAVNNSHTDVAIRLGKMSGTTAAHSRSNQLDSAVVHVQTETSADCDDLEAGVKPREL